MSSCSFARKVRSACCLSATTRVNGRVNVPRFRTLMRSLEPVRLSRALITSAPLAALGIAIRLPRNSCTTTQNLSASMSASATTMIWASSAEVGRCSAFGSVSSPASLPASASSPDGSRTGRPSGNAVRTLPEMRATTV